jgi:hypothetical protein
MKKIGAPMWVTAASSRARNWGECSQLLHRKDYDRLEGRIALRQP